MNTARALLVRNADDPKAQQRAASNPAASVWVNASAGSGKTTILTNRVTRLLLAGVPPQKILCLTFTRAAAAEMALRITKTLSAWAVCSDNELNASIDDMQGYEPSPEDMTRARRLFAEMLACPGGMRIRTLHAFGQEILRRFPIESGLPPHFAVIEDEDARALRDEVLTGLLREATDQSATPTARALTHLIAELGEKAFQECAGNLLREKARLAQAIQRTGSLAKPIAVMRNALDLAPDESETTLLRQAFAEAAFPEAAIREAAQNLQKGTSKYVRRGDEILTWLMQGADERAATYQRYRSCFFTQKGEFFDAYGDKKLLAAYPELDNTLRREAARLQSLDERCATARIAEITTSALIFGHALIERYSTRKRMQAALDYDDLVIETLNLLQRPGIAPWVLHKLDDGLDHLLVDEAQDTSRAQWSIVATLAEEFFAGATAHENNRTLFVVGDEKQSIYSFQNADPEAFADMRDFFRDKITAAEKTCDEIPLRVSFRSAPAILRAVDAVFAPPEVAKGVSAAPVEHVAFKRDRLFGRVELWPLLQQPEASKDATAPWDLPIGYESEQDPQAELAARIASTIAGWITHGECLPGESKSIRPGDIMILLRKRGRFADVMVRALKQKNIAVTGVDRMRLIEQLPVMDVMALIQFTLLPDDDLNLATVLRGPLLGLSENDLMRLAMQRGEISLWQSLKNTADAEPFSSAYAYLSGWLGKADFMSPFVMVSRLLNEPCPANAVSGRKALWSRLGLDALDPIDELLNAAQNFSRHHAPSLQGFLHWLIANDSEIKRELDNDKETGDGQVRIMTVHASKGLEAPIVFLPDTANMPRVQDVPKFLWDDGDRIPLYLVRRPDSGVAQRVWQAARDKQLEEYRRLLYVAMTRASHRLYIGGWELKKKEAGGEHCWHNLVKNGLKHSETGIQSPDETALVWEDAYSPTTRVQPTATPPVPIIPLPAWATRIAPMEKREARALAPSQLSAAPSAATPDQAFKRGRIIHRLLQSLPDVETARREAVAQRFLAHPQHSLNDAQQQDIRDEVIKLLDDPAFAPLFGPSSRAEVPLAGSVDGQPMSGQVDRLAMLNGEAWIVDYKTNRPPPADATDIPEAYRQQMEAYRTVLRAIYPDLNVRCFLVWTYGPRMMEVL